MQKLDTPRSNLDLLVVGGLVVVDVVVVILVVVVVVLVVAKFVLNVLKTQTSLNSI